jgi:hypothetical protein
MLAGFIPFGVGAVYNSQYAKGLAHLFIMAGLIWGMSTNGRLEPLFILGFFFFWVYQIIDAVRSARAIQLGQPAPDPFGLGQTFGAGEKVDLKKVPTGAIVLIVLGGLFLLETTGIFTIEFNRIWPVLLIALGAWLFARGWGLVASSVPRCYCERCRTRRLMGPAILVTIGVLGLVDSFRGLNFFSWVGALLVVIGVVKIVQGNPSTTGHIAPATPGAACGPATPPADTTPQPPVDEVKNV